MFVCCFAAVVDFAKIFVRDCWYFACVEMKNLLFNCVLQLIRSIFGNIVCCELVVILLLLLLLFVADEGSGIHNDAAPHGDILLRTW
jgi:hypothetical protein